MGTWVVGLSREVALGRATVWILWSNLRMASWGQALQQPWSVRLTADLWGFGAEKAFEVGRLGPGS